MVEDALCCSPKEELELLEQLGACGERKGVKMEHLREIASDDVQLLKLNY